MDMSNIDIIINSLKEKLTNIGIKITCINKESKLIDELGMNSFDMMVMCSEIEKEYNIDLNISSLRNVVTIFDFAKLIEKELKKNNKKEKLLVIGSIPAGTLQIVEYAKSKGVYTIVTDYHSVEKSKAKQIADEAWMISVKDIDILEHECKKNNVTAIFCGVDESYIEIVMTLCERLNLPCYLNKQAWEYSRNKFMFKKVCKELNIPVAKDYYVSNNFLKEELEKIEYPVVIKPTDKNSSIGVNFCNNDKELIEAYKEVKKITNDEHIIIEKQINGNEYAFFYALSGGEALLIGGEKFFYQDGFKRQCYSLLSTIDMIEKDYNEQLDKKIKILFKKIGCKEGFAFIQVRKSKDDGIIYVQEMGYRLDGPQTTSTFEKLIDFSPLHWMVDYALGVKHKLNDIPNNILFPSNLCATTYVLWLKGEGTIKKIKGINEIEKLPLFSFTQLCREGKHYNDYAYAFTITFISQNREEIIDTIEKINELIEVKDEIGNELLVKFSNYEKIKNN